MTPETTINKSAGNAARAKNASDAAAQIVVANVLNPIGLRINVAGSSLIVTRNTNTKPATNPGLTDGMTIDHSTCIGL